MASRPLAAANPDAEDPPTAALGAAAEHTEPPVRSLGRAGRVVLAVLVAVLVAGGMVVRLGLVGDDGIGAADNADGARLFCVAELVPVAPDDRAAWRDAVVTEFRTGGEPCPPEAPATSAGLVLSVAVATGALLDTSPAAPDGTHRFSLEWLAALYLGLIALGAGVAAYAVSARRPALRLLTVLVPPLAPLLLVPWWSRFLVSTYAEPAGLVGTVWVALGLLAVAVTRPADRGGRYAALALLAAGGALAATAKPGYLAVGALAFVAAALVAVGTAPRRRRIAGLATAAVVLAVSALPVLSGLRAQDDYYEVVNAHNFAFTAVLPESGPAATAALGLRPEAWERAGEGFFFTSGAGVPGWRETVAERPAELRAAAYRWVATHPRVLARLVQRGMVATMRPQMPYLLSATVAPGDVVGDAPVEFHADAPPFMGPFFAYLDEVDAPWLPAGLVAVSVLGAAATLVPRRRGDPTGWSRVAVRLTRVAAALAVAGTGVVVIAVLGDGYYELIKHVWLGSYAFVVTAGVLAAALVAAGTGAVVARRRR